MLGQTIFFWFWRFIYFLIFFNLVRNITRNKYYGWTIRDYTGMGLIALVLAFVWLRSFGVLRWASGVFFSGTVVAAIFEGKDNRFGALLSGIITMIGVIWILIMF